jgi:hypothetical protein
MLIQLLVNTILQETTFINFYANNPFIYNRIVELMKILYIVDIFFFRQNCGTLSKMMNS